MNSSMNNHTDYILSLSGKTDIDENELCNTLSSHNRKIDWSKIYSFYEEKNDSISLFLKGYMYYKGLNFPKDHVKAEHFFDLAIKKFSKISIYYVGKIYRKKRKDKDEDEDEDEDADEDFDDDQITAYECFTTAVDYGIIKSHYNLACMYMNGYGGGIDIESVIKHFKIAAKNGHVKAIVKIAQHYSQFPDKIEIAIDYLETAVEMGHNTALCYLAAIYLNDENREYNVSIAIKHYEIAVEKKIPYALTQLNLIYSDGLHCDIDEEKAQYYDDILITEYNGKQIYKLVQRLESLSDYNEDELHYRKYYEMAANKGIVDAMVEVAYLYHDDGNSSKAIEYLDMAIVNKLDDTEFLIKIADNVYDGNYDMLKVAVKCYEIAAERGNTYAMKQLGQLHLDNYFSGYFNGNDEFNMAIKYFVMVVEHGDKSILYLSDQHNMLFQEIITNRVVINKKNKTIDIQTKFKSDYIRSMTNTLVFNYITYFMIYKN